MDISKLQTLVYLVKVRNVILINTHESKTTSPKQKIQTGLVDDNWGVCSHLKYAAVSASTRLKTWA